MKLPWVFCAILLLPVLTAFAAGPVVSETAPYPTIGQIVRVDPALDGLLPAAAKIEKLAEGFQWAEGPVWMPKEQQLAFSATRENIAYRWREGIGVEVFLHPSGLTDTNGVYNGREPGSNGLTIDSEGRLVLCQHGDRRVARLNPDGKTFATIADRYDGKRFNSPNDLCFDRKGNLYFTDPPYGTGPSTVREMDYCGVFRVTPDGKVTLLTKELDRPNGIALSPYQHTLYVANSTRQRPVLMAYELKDDGTLGPGRVFFDAAPLYGTGYRGVPDGLRVDQHGNLWANGPGGILIISAEGKHLGTISPGTATANCAFGDDGSTLFIAADMYLCRVRTKTKGCGF
jgi:gluconolactonase